MRQTTFANREKVAGRKAAIELFNDLLQMDAAYVKGFIEIIKGSMPELESKVDVFAIREGDRFSCYWLRSRCLGLLQFR